MAQSLLISIGLYPTDIGIASVTDERRAFNAATFADVLFTNLLYHEDFPLTDGVGVIREFWVSHANEARIKLLQ